MNSSTVLPYKFTSYQKFVVAMLAFLQFTTILDFMILSPLGAILMPALKITPEQFGHVVSAYAFCAGIAGFLTAGFADRFDRKKLLLFFYAGFIVGTLMCGLATTYELLLTARMVTGVFAGVIGSIVFAITTDLFPFAVRGRVMGVVQTAFAASQVLGLPIGLYIANHWGWNSTFLLIVAIAILVGFALVFFLRPINEHLKLQTEGNPLRHLIKTISVPRYLQGFATTALLSTGGFMLMPFTSQFSVQNLGVSLEILPMVYMATGLCAIIAGPLIGRISDRVGKFGTFAFGCFLTIVTVVIYTRMGVSPLFAVIGINIILYVGVSSRMIASSALVSAIPLPKDRGAYMSVSSSLQQISGGLAAMFGGMIVTNGADGRLEHFEILGNIVSTTTLITLVLMFFINKMVMEVKANTVVS